MPAPRKYPNELRKRAQRLVAEAFSLLPLLLPVLMVTARDGVADTDVSDSGSNLDHRSCRAVPDGRLLVQLPA